MSIEYVFSVSLQVTPDDSALGGDNRLRQSGKLKGLCAREVSTHHIDNPPSSTHKIMSIYINSINQVSRLIKPLSFKEYKESPERIHYFTLLYLWKMASLITYYLITRQWFSGLHYQWGSWSQAVGKCFYIVKVFCWWCCDYWMWWSLSHTNER